MSSPGNHAETQSGGSFNGDFAWGSLWDYDGDQTFSTGDLINIQWTTTLSEVNLYVWQGNSTSQYAYIASMHPSLIILISFQITSVSFFLMRCVD